MSSRRDLPLEEKLKIVVKEMPFSEDTKEKLSKVGVYDLGDIVKRFHKYPGTITMGFFSYKTFAETGYLVVRMGFDASRGDFGSRKQFGGRDLDCFTSRGVWVRVVSHLSKEVRDRIDAYVNENVPYSGEQLL